MREALLKKLLLNLKKAPLIKNWRRKDEKVLLRDRVKFQAPLFYFSIPLSCIPNILNLWRGIYSKLQFFGEMFLDALKLFLSFN